MYLEIARSKDSSKKVLSVRLTDNLFYSKDSIFCYLKATNANSADISKILNDPTKLRVTATVEIGSVAFVNSYDASACGTTADARKISVVDESVGPALRRVGTTSFFKTI